MTHPRLLDPGSGFSLRHAQKKWFRAKTRRRQELAQPLRAFAPLPDQPFSAAPRLRAKQRKQGPAPTLKVEIAASAIERLNPAIPIILAQLVP